MVYNQVFFTIQNWSASHPLKYLNDSVSIYSRATRLICGQVSEQPLQASLQMLDRIFIASEVNLEVLGGMKFMLTLSWMTQPDWSVLSTTSNPLVASMDEWKWLPCIPTICVLEIPDLWCKRASKKKHYSGANISNPSSMRNEDLDYHLISDPN